MGRPLHRILLVDDDPAYRSLLERRFARFTRLTLDTAPSVESGLRMAQGIKYSLVLLDWRMPGPSGLEAVGAFLRASGAILVVLAGAYVEQDEALALMELGVEVVLKGPGGLDLNDLARHVSSLVHRRIPT